jgi:hypothetical protein
VLTAGDELMDMRDEWLRGTNIICASRCLLQLARHLWMTGLRHRNGLAEVILPHGVYYPAKFANEEQISDHAVN